MMYLIGCDGGANGVRAVGEAVGVRNQILGGGSLGL